MSVEIVLPPDGVLLHIGPPKTGTTAIQRAMFARRDELAGLGIRCAGDGPHPREAVAAGVGKEHRSGLRPSEDAWAALVAEVKACPQLVFVSSEGFADATPEAIRRCVKELGGDRVHVVITARPLAAMLPSAWQQYVRNGLLLGYDEWLQAMLGDNPKPRVTASFWYRHRYDHLVARWGEVVGADRIRFAPVGGVDRLALPRAFEEILGLPDGFLELQPSADNRSLTFGEAELVRRLNREFKDRGWYDAHYNALIRRGAVERMRLSRAPADDELPITTPRWALDAAAVRAAEIVRGVAAAGVPVLGDLETLAADADRASVRDADGGAPSTVAIDAAVEALIGALSGDGFEATDEAAIGRRLSSVRAKDIVKALGRRAVRRLSPP
jgi:hypothetical protein